MGILSHLNPSYISKSIRRHKKQLIFICFLLFVAILLTLPHVPLTWGMTALHLLASHGSIIVDDTFSSHQTKVLVCCPEKWNGELPSILQNRSYLGNAAAWLLLTLGANPNARDSDGWTPLHWAVWIGDPELVAVLLSHGADVEIRAYSLDLGMVMTDIGGSRPNTPWQRRAKRSKVTPFECTFANDRVAIAAMLIEHGFDYLRRDKWNSTPLHDAAASGATRIVELLVNKGADVNARDHDGWPPLHWAVFSFDAMTEDTVSELLQGGADVNARTSHMKTIPAPPGAFFIDADSTALIIAIEYERWSIVRMLIEAGADPTIADHSGETAFTALKSWNNTPPPLDIVTLISHAMRTKNYLIRK